jgi:hypothetical protein
MLPSWNPDRLVKKIPFNLALIGGRRMGKSTTVSDLLWRMRKEFDLVIAFIGSAACNPTLRGLMEKYWDSRFFFSEWNVNLISTLLEQQEAQKLRTGVTRNVLILVDDVVLSSEADEQVAHMGMRGRHFGVSLMMCSVSWTSINKRARRSLDCVLVYSMPMSGDLKVLTSEFAQQQTMARFALRSLKDYEALVLETLEKRQRLFSFQANLLTENSSCTEPEKSETSASPDSGEECPESSRRYGSVGPPDRILSEEPACSSVSARNGLHSSAFEDETVSKDPR